MLGLSRGSSKLSKTAQHGSCGVFLGRFLAAAAAATVAGQSLENRTACAPGARLQAIFTGATGAPRYACAECTAGMYSVGGEGAQCLECPRGTWSAYSGASVCHCKENFYFDTVAAATVPQHRWPTLGCTDCLTLLPVKEALLSLECPGGPTRQLDQSRNQANGSSLAPLGPLIAQSGWYIEGVACAIDREPEGAGAVTRVNRTCITRHSCAGTHCFGLKDSVRKELTDMRQASGGFANHTVRLRMVGIAWQLFTRVSLNPLTPASPFATDDTQCAHARF